MDFLILLAVFVALLALAYVTYRNISNLDSRLRRIEDILKNAQVVAEPVHLPPSTGFAAANVSTNPGVARPVASRSPSAPKTITHFQPSQTGSGSNSGSGFGVPGWGGENAPSVPVHVERVAEPEFSEDESVSVNDNVETDDVSVDEQGDGDNELEVADKEEEGEEIEVDADEEEIGDDVNEEEFVNVDEEVVEDDEEASAVDNSLSAEDKATRTIQVDADFDDSELTLDDILSNMEQENLRSAPAPVPVQPQPQAQAQVQRNYDELKVVEIREILRKANVSIPANAKKSEMIALMKQRGL
jgi:hypothetical protein